MSATFRWRCRANILSPPRQILTTSQVAPSSRTRCYERCRASRRSQPAPFGRQALDLRNIDGWRPALVTPSDFALATPSRWRSSMISRSQVATPARIVSISRAVELPSSRVSKPIDWITRPTPRLVRSASMLSSSAVERAKAVSVWCRSACRPHVGKRGTRPASAAVPRWRPARRTASRSRPP